jgi:hypothetical protein
VSITLFRRRRAADQDGPVERPEVRQYRYLLRTADIDALDRLHGEALAALDLLIRAHILRTTQDRMLSGRELTVDDIAGLAHLVSTGESQTPGILLSALTEAAVERLAHMVITRPEAIPLLEGYAAWDGVDPDPSRGVAVENSTGRRGTATAGRHTASPTPGPGQQPQGTPRTAAQGA